MWAARAAPAPAGPSRWVLCWRPAPAARIRGAAAPAVLERSRPGWQARVDGALLARLPACAGPGGAYADGFAGLLRFMRNVAEHSPAGAQPAPLVAALQEAGVEAAGLGCIAMERARRTLLAQHLLVLFPALALACHA